MEKKTRPGDRMVSPSILPEMREMLRCLHRYVHINNSKIIDK